MSKFSRYVERILEENNFEFNEFINVSGISKSYYYKLAKDSKISLSIVVATNIAKGLNVHLEEFFEGIGVIGVINEYLVTDDQALYFMHNNEEFIKMCGMDINKLTTAEINEYVNFIFKCMKMGSYKYI